jgi:hypothetical protein
MNLLITSYGIENLKVEELTECFKVYTALEKYAESIIKKTELETLFNGSNMHIQSHPLAQLRIDEIKRIIENKD